MEIADAKGSEVEDFEIQESENPRVSISRSGKFQRLTDMSKVKKAKLEA